MRNKYVNWLKDQIPELVQNDVINEDTASRLLTYYAEHKLPSARNKAIIIISILGASLIGLGVLLLLGHNWAEFSRNQKVALGFLPLVTSHLLALFTVFKRQDSIAWRESVGILMSVAVGTAIAIVGQAYQMPGDTDKFLMVWMLLIIPASYLLRAITPTVVFLVGIVVWAGFAQHYASYAVQYWFLLLLVVPQLWMFSKEDDRSTRHQILIWALLVTMLFGMGISVEKILPGLWILIYGSFFALLYLYDKAQKKDYHYIWELPLRITGFSGSIIFALFMTFRWPWEEIGYSFYRTKTGYYQFAGYFDYAITLIFLAVVILLLYKVIKRKSLEFTWIGLLPVFLIISYLIAGFATDDVVPTILMNIYAFIAGLILLIIGIKNETLGKTNLGMGILSILIFLRFLDTSFDFSVRGIVFIVLGAGFLTANIVLSKKWRAE